MAAHTHLSSDDPQSSVSRWRLITAWWSDLFDGGDPGATTWEVLEEIQQKVTDCRAQEPPDLGRAESLTFKAFHLAARNGNPTTLP